MMKFIFTLALLGALASNAIAAVNDGVRYESIVTNFDGSITVTSPSLSYGGHFYEVLASTSTYRFSCTKDLVQQRFPDSIEGLCFLFGKTKVTNVQTALRSFTKGEMVGKDWTSIELSRSGNFNRFVSVRYRNCLAGSPLVDLNVIASISCK